MKKNKEGKFIRIIEYIDNTKSSLQQGSWDAVGEKVIHS